MTFATHFYIYLQWVHVRLAQRLKCGTTSRHFQPREGPSTITGPFSVIVKPMDCLQLQLEVCQSKFRPRTGTSEYLPTEATDNYTLRLATLHPLHCIVNTGAPRIYLFIKYSLLKTIHSVSNSNHSILICDRRTSVLINIYKDNHFLFE